METSARTDASFLPAQLRGRLDAPGWKALSIYVDQLLAWNRVLNLSGFETRERIFQELVADSFHLADFLDALFPEATDPRTVDLGAGAGLPGIPLRLLWHAGHYTMVEAREKRALFLSNVLSRLKLPDTQVFRGRAEIFLPRASSENKLDCVLSRAFMPWPKLAAFCAPFLADTGFLIIMSNQKAPESMAGWTLYQTFSYPSRDRSRYLWALRKAPDIQHD